MPIVSQYLGSNLIKSHLRTVSVIQCFSWKWQGNKRVLSFSRSFRYFPENKSRKQNAETEQARPHLHFAPKIIKIHLTVLENESFEVYMLFQKSIKNGHVHETPSCMYGYWNFVKAAFEWAIQQNIHAWSRALRMTVFSTFLKLACKLQSTRSRRLPNGFW